MNRLDGSEETFTVDLEPVGRRAAVSAGMTLLGAAQGAGVEIAAVCGGSGTCGKCRVQCIEGKLSAPTASELRFFNETELAAGYRLACQAVPLGDVKINIPPGSLSTPQRLQIEGQETEIAPDPVIEILDVDLVPPTLHDLRSDTVRLTDALADQGVDRPFFGQPVLRSLSTVLRDEEWSLRLALRRVPTACGRATVSDRDPGVADSQVQPLREVVGAIRRDQPAVGLAVDIGTTKIAAYLVDLVTG
ncbi:MAG: 2Fe-2S iron-sulfur cluster-binding protein, partial [Anaerolineae bacterium]|nr:2Fe-2S iron-sulfur cluster-binding protein [Anaerolineae bacterium]